ncbi:hypothetical protein [Paenibacillus herberti]|uniref:Uncharacterized protein n=1 Tax=Paenibacillus herberti TaxID=1619309 RepID=A0A229P4Z6_9BACL|nr:hypothetical protein [Paenibacillus herberti]OXM17024.1 hypothetical protein CGZ75_10455 [Paenibacillus herberti]
MSKNRIKKLVVAMSLGSLLSLTVLQPISAENSSVSNIEKKSPITTVESYIIETYSDTQNSEGYFEKIGYEVVSATTKIVEGTDDTIEAETSSVSDFYSNDGSYIKTVIKNDHATNNYSTGKALVKNQNVTTSSPANDNSQLASFIKNKDTFEKNTLDTDQQLKLSKKIEERVKLLPDAESREVKGISRDELEKVKQKIAEQTSKRTVSNTTSDSFVDTTLPSVADQSNFSTSSSMMVSTCPSNTNGVESCGAWDNYYRHNILNGDFTVQVLGHAGEDSMYSRLHGSIGTDTAKATRLSTFKQQINTYERYIVDDLEAGVFWEIVGWASALASFILLVQGFGTGPVGWVAVVALYSNAILTFAGFTSSAYATNARLQISKNAASQLSNAKTTHYNMLYNFDHNYGSVYESGF